MQKQKLSNTTKLFTTSSSRSSCRPLLLPPSSPPPIIPPKSSRRPSSDSNHSDSSESNPNTIISHIVSTKLKCVLQCLLDCQQAMSEKKSPKVIRIYVKNFIEQFEQFELFITENNKSRIINLSSDDKKLYHEIGFFQENHEKSISKIIDSEENLDNNNENDVKAKENNTAC
ncbi:9874_t:CDS:2 [Entrophospora sp. SA101]|nr:9874_t:CDS:2 [Entrophospora sp. SA101]